MHSFFLLFDTTKSSELIQYLFVFTFGFDDDNSSRVLKDGRKLNKCPEIERSGKRYGVGEIRRTEIKKKLCRITMLLYKACSYIIRYLFYCT